MSGARQSSRPRKASARAREAAADTAEEPKTPIKRQKQTKTVATPAPPPAEEDDAWAQRDACQKWRLLPKDHVVDEGKPWTCSLVGRSCDERADDDTEPMGTVTPEPPPPTQHPVSLKDLDTKPEDRAKVMRMKCPELRDALRAKGLSVDGLKETLQARLLNPTSNDVSRKRKNDPKVTTFRKRERRNGRWGPWVDTVVGEDGLTYRTRRDGGIIRIYRNFESMEDRVVLQATVAETNLFRQYKFGNVPEPRVHMLLAPESAPGCAYSYHGVTMRASSIEQAPCVKVLADKCTAKFGKDWNVGVDVVAYRDGYDSCGWHADDTQGETLIVAVILQSGGGPRRVQFRPKTPDAKYDDSNGITRRSKDHIGERPLQDGDEEIELWIEEGDCYTMDRGVQIGYEHQVPKVPSYGSRRVVAILREGQPRFKKEGADTGTPNASLEPPERWDYEKNGGRFGKIANVDEGEGVYYSREHLCATGGHNQAQRGVSGSLERGAESVVVSLCSSKMREADGVSWLRYTSTRKQGAASLWRNLVSNGQPIRVFRSSKLANAWAPPLLNGKKEPAQYRYDGLYDIACMWDDAGNRSVKEPSQAPPVSRGKKRKEPPSVPRTVATRGVRPDSLQALPPPATPAVVPAPPVSPQAPPSPPTVEASPPPSEPAVVSPQAPPSMPAAVRPDSLQALPPPPPPAETLGNDAMDCDGRGPAPTAGTDFVVPPVRQSYKQPIDAAGASDDGRPMPGLVAETAAAAPEVPAPAPPAEPAAMETEHTVAPKAEPEPAPEPAASAPAAAAAEADDETLDDMRAKAANQEETTPPPADASDDGGPTLALAPIAPATAADGEDLGAPAYTFLLRRREDVNACSNAELVERLTKQAGGLAPPPDLMPETLPRLAWVCDAAPDRYDDDDEDYFGGPGGYKRARCMPEVDLKARCAELLGEMVALTVAEAGGLHGGEGAPIWSGSFVQQDYARWLAHRRLLWRSLRFAKQRKCPPPIDNCTGAEWAEALQATTERSVMAMVAAAQRRAHCAPVVEDILEEDVAEGLCALCGAGADDEAPEGPLMAFRKGDERVLVHQACASCSSEVYFDMQSRLCNVLKAVKRGRGLKCAAGKKCSRPKKSGATAGCSVASCKRSYHVRCCLDTGWTFGPNKTFFCPVHRRANYDPKDMSDDWWKFDCQCGRKGLNFDDGTAMWECSRCGSWQHAACAGGSEDAEAPDDYACFRCRGSA